LNLDHAPVIGPGLKELAALQNLKVLHLRFTKVTGADLKELAPLKDLKGLYLSYTPITDVDLKEVAHFKNLEQLSLVGTKVTGAGLKELIPLQNLKELKLHLKSTAAPFLGGFPQGADDGLKDLAALPKLEKLGLAGDGLTDNVLKDLAELKNLKELTLPPLKKIPAGVLSLQKALPMCKIMMKGMLDELY
jgi:Leucine-rich repeat (LRR) protein